VRIYLLWEDYLEDRLLWGVFSSREKLEEAINKLYGRYRTEVGNIWWEEAEMDELMLE
jgi:hypothetical protein